MKVRRDDTEEARKYWKFLDECAERVSTWPDWKRGSNPNPKEQQKGEIMTKLVRTSNGHNWLDQFWDHSFDNLFKNLTFKSTANVFNPVTNYFNDEGNNWSLSMDVPGVGANNLDVTTENGVLIVKTLPSESKQLYRSYNYQVAIPENSDTSKVTANLKNGVLNIQIPKANPESSQVNKIKVTEG